ncbi:hypothetical protein BOH78_1572 [Pichia kudriavzevii]|uniref:Uncharacterized protein n=1 Tax=Pichia kudriavzevii TaxID=4909 RepID=A0A099NQB4_PICKU|nr:hypothetical protein JL09_g5938 [Pichia kudriavzevii]ONH70459.1 hypothetical protein BOH78_5203 [Pichia kudriavzevii]ONH75905.1 hypothetical protein BOH78_1572 [Pichia kudriavzevii]
MEKTGIESNWTNMEILIVSDFPVRIYFQFAGMEFSIGIDNRTNARNLSKHIELKSEKFRFPTKFLFWG